MENQNLNDQLEAIKKLNKENYDNLRKQIFLLNEALNKNFSRPEEKKETVKEKEYTILSFVAKNGEMFVRSGIQDFLYIADNRASGISEEIGLKAYSIHSVRRESDGEVFTLGDLDNPSMNPITSITINEDYGGIALHGRNFTQGLSHAKKAPIRKPILVTEDGVEIFEGDVCFVVKDNNTPYRALVTEYVSKSWIEGKKFFSTKEAAEEYIKWNKPMYSLNDVSEARDKCFNVGREIVDVLEKLDRK